ncbi:MAG: S16 family serine protease, partial [Candidatus Micrarchaeota archaeon]|nr:S16 family serine protease [Candidatus Micrarchaeota archaeon]
MDEIIKEHGGYIVIALLAVALSFTLGFESGSQGQTVRTVIVQQSGGNATLTLNDNTTKAIFQSVSLLLPGIDEERRGAVANLEVQRKSGTGKVYIDIDQGTAFIANETLISIKTAMRVARLFSGETSSAISTSDLFYSLKAKSNEVGGSSAGAAITIATIALLEDKQLNESIAISGTINSDGSIGPVGGILEKARVLKTKGIITFLVP